MPFFDFSLDVLYEYKPPRFEPDNFDAFWQQTLNVTRETPLDAVFKPVEEPLALIDAYDVTFNGYGGQPIKGWYLRPRNVTTPLPCVVEFIGYGGGRGYPHDWLFWPTIAGYATLIMDTRGQGSSWRQGDTPDIPDHGNPHVPGFMTQGILNPHHYYYRRVFTDAVRAVEAAKSRDDVDSNRIAVTGASQGGGIAIAVAGLMKDSIDVCMPDVPFLCHFRNVVGKTDANPYEEIVRFLKTHVYRVDQVFNTLDYFDGVNFSSRITATSLYSTALMDEVCPPSSVFAAYNQVTAYKSIQVYQFNQHEGGGSHHALEKMRFIRDIWKT